MDKRLECKCGGEFEYDGYESVEIEEGYFVIKGDCKCDKCGIEAKYREEHLMRATNEADVYITKEVDGVEEEC